MNQNQNSNLELYRNFSLQGMQEAVSKRIDCDQMKLYVYLIFFKGFCEISSGDMKKWENESSLRSDSIIQFIIYTH